ncbi:MAG: hypothetical protein K8T25_13760 [Planctomycetia bacterium]|nr:hypothetical protein [Planctomycetia bacterium]
MTSPSTHDWQLYEARCRTAQLEWLRSRTPAEKLVLYEDLYRFGSVGRAQMSGRERVELRRWNEKLAIRRKLSAIFAKADQLPRE